jgi:transcription elongation factor Elf1
MKRAVRTKKVPLKKIKITFDCPECGGEGYIEIPYCPSQVAIEPAWEKQECETCGGNGTLTISLEELLRKIFPKAYSFEEICVIVEKEISEVFEESLHKL